MDELKKSLQAARDASWQRFGRSITFYLPGMFIYNNMTGRYPALSITGGDCALMCNHCRGEILKSMIEAKDPRGLVKKCRELESRGAVGILLSGGCDHAGRLPWHRYLKAIEEIKTHTGLIVSAHTGFVDTNQARELKVAGLDQALVDVIGDRLTYQSVYHLSHGPELLLQTLAALNEANLAIIPHIVCGLNGGRITSESRAIDMLTPFFVDQLVIVSLMKLPKTPSSSFVAPSPEEVAHLMIRAREKLPHTRLSLGCARQRGSRELEVLAIRAGVNSMALPSDEAIEEAEKYNLDIRYQKTCCSISADLSTPTWN